jgi:predicted polyphosphate/ATP-dependent NAD kinase
MAVVIGLIVNPIAGMGGKVGLKGTDGDEVLLEAKRRGALPESGLKAETMLKILTSLMPEMMVLTANGSMGETYCKNVGIPYSCIYNSKKISTYLDTIKSAEVLNQLGVSLLVFAGGDGTARNIYTAVGDEIPVIGIPTGVKIHSGVFGLTPRQTAMSAYNYLIGKKPNLKYGEVMDIDEDSFRRGIVSAKLYGYMKMPNDVENIQTVKSSISVSDECKLDYAAQYIVDNMNRNVAYIISSGTSTAKIMEVLNLKNTLLGIDIIMNKTVLINDATEADILNICDSSEVKIIVSPIGGQGFIFGRGNQQISSKVLSKISKIDIIILSSVEKLSRIASHKLRLDTGDEDIDKLFSGPYRVITGYNDFTII